MNIGDQVRFRRYPGAHEETGRVIGRTFGKQFFDVETDDGETVQNVPADALRLKEGR